MINLAQKLKKAAAQQNNNVGEHVIAPSSRMLIRDRLLQPQVAELTADVIPASATVEFPDPNVLHSFRIVLRPTEGHWRGGRFVFDVEVPEEYNMVPPKVICRTRLWHPNITEEGKVCLSVLRQNSLEATGWTPSRGLKDVVFGLDALFTDLLNFDDPLNQHAATQYRDNREGFERKVRDYIEKYAKDSSHSSHGRSRRRE
ncbi:NEDD8-conjugating enzyme UBE2F-like isoform X2 [Varroa jacobsoni]|nr:NEDD8-conjugating enzyme UBE2F-like isoform X2 [Varroa destructor]XP_022687338.1 NEDD8-conjugating enzyme UBE2F-like isoform X2 [Varroa jacobsoni]